MNTIKKLISYNHQYYCNNSNYYSNEPNEYYETVTDFLDVFEDADIDMNLIFRWDIKLKEDSEKNYYVEIFIIQQRKGIFKPIYIKSITEEEAKRLELLLAKHFEVLKNLWKPFN
jgi:hypothetical protein